MAVTISTIDALQGVNTGAATGGATADANGTVATVAGWDGAFLLFVANGAGTATLTVQTSLDPTFAVAQNRVVPPVLKLWDSVAGGNTTPTEQSGVLSIAANTSYLFSVSTSLPYLRTVISGSSGLGAGSTVTGLSS